MPQETKICQNCKKEFVIEPEDFDFYEKIKVPPPTWCPECRLKRRLVFKNIRTLYKRKCDLCSKDIISIFHHNVPFPVYCSACWWSDKWDVIEYGRDYDFSKTFFEQFFDLLKKVPKVDLYIDYPRIINSPYVNLAGPLKNCYLLFLAEDCENCYYSSSIIYSKDSMDCLRVRKVSLSYGLLNCQDCYRTFFSVDCRNCYNIYFCNDLNNCSDCFGCSSLRNKKYYIFNKPFSKAEYLKMMEGFNFGSYKNFERLQNKAENFWIKIPKKFIHGYHNNNVSGDYIYNSKNVFDSFYVIEGRDCKYCLEIEMKQINNCYDYGDWGNNASYIYEAVNCGENINNIKFSYCSWIGTNLNYCDVCVSNHNLFGCISLRNKQYCILNKQYTKEEYEKLVPKIIQHMNDMPYVDKKGRVYKYGEFFPPELSPFCYNETIAKEYFPLTKEEAIKQGYRWKDPEERNVKPDLYTNDLPDHIKDVSDSIIGKIIQCSHAKIKEDGTLEATCNEQCTTAFKIIEPELQFYKRMNLPLPRLCPNCRHYQRLKQRNPLKLWHRKCMCTGQTCANGIYKNTVEHFHGDDPCPNEFETTYAPDRPEIVYCEKCYLAEVV